MNPDREPVPANGSFFFHTYAILHLICAAYITEYFSDNLVSKSKLTL